jgi:hypothetical protein
MKEPDMCPECGESYGDFQSRMDMPPNEMIEEYECVGCDTRWTVVYQIRSVRWETYAGIHENTYPNKQYDPNEPF